MSRREYTTYLICAEPGCGERTISVADTRRERQQDDARYARNPWRCWRHRKPDEVLSATNTDSTTVLVAQERGAGITWAGASSGYVHGPGFQAEADDFPPGTRLIITARIELPTEESENPNV